MSNDMRIALFIDFENLVTRTSFTASSFDLQPALDLLLEKGKVVFRRAYCDWGRFPAAKQHLHDKGVELIDVPPSTRSGKNGADIRLVIDALELAYQREHIDVFAIASGDSDFCPLAYKLRENKRYVIGLAVREASSPLFVKACDEFIYLTPPKVRAEKKAEPVAEAPKKPGRRSRAKVPVAAPVAAPPKPPPPAPAPKAKPSRRGKKAAPPEPQPEPQVPPPPPPQAQPPQQQQRQQQPQRQKQAQPQKPPPVVPDVAREAAAAILAKATERVNPSTIKDAIVRRQPDFDVRDHGFSTFSRLLEAMEKAGLLKREKTASGQWYVVPA
jgi:uncharacterized LabA/DUF88 family protein